eukprot:sb/3479120/
MGLRWSFEWCNFRCNLIYYLTLTQQSDPDLPGPDIPGSPIYRAKHFPPRIPVNRGPTVLIFFHDSSMASQIIINNLLLTFFSVSDHVLSGAADPI